MTQSNKTSDEQQYSEHYGVAMYNCRDAAQHITDLCSAVATMDIPDAKIQLMDTIAKLARACIELEQSK